MRQHNHGAPKCEVCGGTGRSYSYGHWGCSEYYGQCRKVSKPAPEPARDQPCWHCGIFPSFTLNNGRPEPTCNCALLPPST